jgi:predicted RNA-binding protein (virulence factor B family)
LAKIGRRNLLEVLKLESHGAYLQGGWLGEILLPKRYVPEDCEIGDPLDVFIYLDSKDRFIATTQKARAQVGEVAYLPVSEINNVGAFLDWGLPKDLLVPYNQQQITMEEGKSYLVYLYTDEETHRIAATSNLNKYIEKFPEGYTQGQAVDLIVSALTDIGYSAVINHQDWGVIFYSDVVKPLTVGQKVKGFIKRIRDDGKIDLSIQAPGFAKVENISSKIMNMLAQRDGFIPLSDKSPPEEIYDTFAVSKKSYKMALGTLYKQRLIRIEKQGIYLIKEENKESH